MTSPLPVLSIFGLLIFAAFSPEAARAQVEILWSLTAGEGRAAGARAVILNRDGDYVMAGFTTELGTDEHPDGYLAAFSPDGTLLWEAVYETIGLGTSLYAVAQAPDGGYIIAGSRETDEDYDFRQGRRTEAYYARTMASGELLWEGGFRRNYRDVFHTAVPTSDGGYLLGGEHILPRGGSPSAILFQVDAEGELVFETPLARVAVLSHVEAQPDGEILALLSQAGQVLAVTVNSNGEVVEQVSGPVMGLSAAAALDGGGFVVAGNRRPGSGCASPPEGPHGAVVAQLDTSGMSQWSTMFGSICDYPTTRLLTISERADGGFLGIGLYSPEVNQYTFFVALLSSDGDLVRSEAFDALGFGYVTNLASVLDAEGHVILAGSSYERGLFVAKIRVEGEKVSTDPPLPSADLSLGQNHPNPFAPRTTIRYALPASEHVRLAVFDVTGREVMLLADGVKAAGEHTVTVDASRLPSGVYLYRLETPSGHRSKRMILMR